MWSRYRRGIVVALGMLAQALTVGLIPTPWDKWAAIALAALAALGVHAAPDAERSTVRTPGGSRHRALP